MKFEQFAFDILSFYGTGLFVSTFCFLWERIVSRMMKKQDRHGHTECGNCLDGKRIYLKYLPERLQVYVKCKVLQVF